MSFRLEMLQVCRLAPKVLGNSTALVRDFVSGQQNADGGFRNRDGQSDLYYTMFAVESLVALQATLPVEKLRGYLHQVVTERLDFVHLCCLARCWTALAPSAPEFAREVAPRCAELLRQIEAFRTDDGGYSPTEHRSAGTVYGCYLGMGAYQDVNHLTAQAGCSGTALPDAERLGVCLEALRTTDGAYANERNMAIGSTNATAAAVTLLRHLNQPVPASVGRWLLARSHPMGGFLAAPSSPVPDLLSTATALHALAGLQCEMSPPLQERCLDFVDSLWTNAGSFHGNWTDELVDCEYTFYGLLALGHLVLG